MTTPAQTAEEIAMLVSGALTALAPALGPAAAAVAVLAPNIPALVAFIAHEIEVNSGRDPVVVALEAMLEAKRAEIDRELAAKYVKTDPAPSSIATAVVEAIEAQPPVEPPGNPFTP